MKLWWPHAEALIAFAMAYNHTHDPAHWRRFKRVAEYTFSRFVDKKDGEWFGYLNRRGEVTHRFKGGPYKGCFHVPRCLFLVEQELERIVGDAGK